MSAMGKDKKLNNTMRRFLYPKTNTQLLSIKLLRCSSNFRRFPLFS